MGDPYFYPEGESDCCGAPSVVPIDDYGYGICSQCREHASFEETEEE